MSATTDENGDKFGVHSAAVLGYSFSEQLQRLMDIMQPHKTEGTRRGDAKVNWSMNFPQKRMRERKKKSSIACARYVAPTKKKATTAALCVDSQQQLKSSKHKLEAS